jgi:aminoglycoside/choline kinase family phosphotransferase
MSLFPPDKRISILSYWLKNNISIEIQQLETASSDASFRRYFRIRHKAGCHIVMDAPPDKENIQPFIQIAQLFQSAKLHVPQIHAINAEQGFLLLEDFGSTSLQDALTNETANSLYRQALDTLFRLQTSISIHSCQLPVYNTALLERELGIFDEWFMEKLLGLVLPIAIREPLHQLLIDSALEQPQVCVHRDYHSRNLMITKQNSPGILDFQDAVIGPISYDLVSLLRDCYIDWPNPLVEQWAYQYYLQLLAANMLSVKFMQFKRWFDLMGLQRHLKAVGIFSRLHLRDNKSNYLADIPRTLGYICQVSQTYPELQPFNQFIQQQVLPIYRTAL